MAVNMKTDYSSRFPLEIRGHTFYVNFDQYKEFDSLYKLDEYGQRGCISFPAHRGYNCPRLWLNHTELEHVHNTHTSPSSLLYYLKDDRGSFVCLDNYIFINKGTDLNNNLSFISFGIICYVYFIQCENTRPVIVLNKKGIAKAFRFRRNMFTHQRSNDDFTIHNQYITL